MANKEDRYIFKDPHLHNLIDYIYENGNQSFKDKEFNEVDNLIFSTLAYIPFERFEKVNEKFQEITIQEACIDYLAWIRIDFINEHFPEWMRKSILLAMSLLKTKRFSNCKIVKIKDYFSPEEQTQFFAICIKLEDNTLIVSYRGTDTSILGWRENLDMIYKKEICGQVYAQKFLLEVLDEFPKLKFRTTGHSKGGNLAIYSCIGLKDKFFDRLIACYSNDGPGYWLEVVQSPEFIKIAPKINLYVVECDMIGGLMNNVDPIKVVKSNPPNDYIFEHDPFNWNVLGDEFVKVNDRTLNSKIITTGSTKWFMRDDFSIEDRECFVDTLFNVIESSGFEDINDIMSEPKKFIFKALSINNQLSKEKRKLVTSEIFDFVKCLLDVRSNLLKGVVIKDILYPNKDEPEAKLNYTQELKIEYTKNKEGKK